MMVRVQLPRVLGTTVWLEYLLLFCGLALCDYYIWFNVDANFQQSYDSWALDQTLAARSPSLRGYLAYSIHAPWLAPADTEVAAKAVTSPPSPGVTGPRRSVPLHALIGRVEIPRLHLEAMVREGVDDATLRTSAGHVPSTALPGEDGNFAVAAHRDTLFRGLRGIRKDDRISIETPAGSYDYVVDSMKIVQPSDVSVLKGSKGDQTLTLITCYPFNYIGSAPNRFIVKARKVDVSAQSRGALAARPRESLVSR